MKNNNANRMILDDMKAKILRGEYPVGSKLPSVHVVSCQDTVQILAYNE